MNSQNDAKQAVMSCVDSINREDLRKQDNTSAMISHSGDLWVRVKGLTSTSKTWSGCALSTI